MASEKVIVLGDAEFNNFISESETPVLVDFWAGWCGPCKMIAPIVEEIAAEFEGKVQFAKLDVDENKVIPGGLRINSIPTLILFNGGQEMERCIGFKTKEEFRRLLNKHL